MIDLIPIESATWHKELLYSLLGERTPEQSISHRKMPSFKDHCQFIDTHPYEAWYFIVQNSSGIVGSVYLTRQREVGIFIFNAYQGMGHGKRAIAALRELHPGKLLANINPKNEGSIRLFEGMGFRHIQNTYELSDE